MSDAERSRRASTAVQETAREDEAVVVIISDADGNFTVAGTHPRGQAGIADLLAVACGRTATGDGQYMPRLPRKEIT